MTPTQNMVLSFALPIIIVAVAAADDTAVDDSSVDEAKLEADAAVIGEIVLEKSDVFDLSDERENNGLYRLVNKLHIMTRDEVILRQLLFEPGDLYSKRLVAESERILRENDFLFDVLITPKANEDGTVDLTVATRDTWTLKPSLSLSREGGENKTTVGVHEKNLLGRGQSIRLERTENVDRDSNTFEFSDEQLGSSWVSATLLISDNSDGHSNFLSLIRPFFALDARWTAGATAFDDDRRSTLYDLGEQVAEYQHEHEQFTAFGGWSAGLNGGWVRRYTTGVVFDDNQFSDVVNGELQPAVPEDRELAYPFLKFEVLQDQFEKTHNRDRMERTEDFFTGTRYTATLGFSKESFGSDRDAVLYRTSYSRGFGVFDKNSLLLDIWASGREEGGDSKNAVVGFNARFYRPQSDKRLFFMTMHGTHGHDLDLDNPIELGGDTGLRGYPLRYQSGDASFLFSVEQRYFWDWYPFRLFRVGGAVFFDVGRTWGDNPVSGGESLGWLRDVGFGFRFAPTRTGARKILHLDIAFPLDGDDSIDSVQILLESKHTF